MGLQPPAVPLPPAHFRDDAWFVELKSVVDRLNAALLQGTGSPESVVTAAPGTLYRKIDATGADGLWIKESAANLATGWRSL